MAQDFLSALRAAWAADATLAAAGIVPLGYGVDTGRDYPYAVATSLGTKITSRNFGPGQIHEEHYRINIFADDPDEAATLGVAARTFLDSLAAAPPTFNGGRLVDCHQTGEDLVLTSLRKPGPGAQPYIWLKSLTWTAKIARDRS